MSAGVEPFCEGPDLPKLQLLFGHPGLHGDGSSQLGRLLLLGPQRTRAQAFPLWRRRFCLKEKTGEVPLQLMCRVAQSTASSLRQPFWVSLLPRGQMIFRMQYSERMPYGPTSLRLMISVVVMSVSVVSDERRVN